MKREPSRRRAGRTRGGRAARRPEGPRRRPRRSRLRLTRPVPPSRRGGRTPPRRRHGETAPRSPPARPPPAGSSHLTTGGGLGKPLARPAARTWRLPAAGPRRRLPVVAARAAAGSEQPPQRRRLHRGAVTMGRTDALSLRKSPPGGRGWREGAGGEEGRRHLERVARPGACLPPSWARRGAGAGRGWPAGLSLSPPAPWGGPLGPGAASRRRCCAGGTQSPENEVLKRGFKKRSEQREGLKECGVGTILFRVRKLQ